MRRLIVSSMVSSSSSRARGRERHAHRRRGLAALAGVRLVDDDGEAAVRGARSPISSRMKGNFWTVVMMIFLPSSMNRRRSPECSAWPTVAPTWANCLIVSRICLSRIRRSVTTMIESKTGSSSFAQADQLVGEPGDGVGLAAAGRVLDQVAPAGAVLRGVGEQLAGRRRAGGSAGRSGRAFFLPVFSSFSSTIWA